MPVNFPLSKFALEELRKDFKPLSTRRIKAAKEAINEDLNILNGEAWVQIKDEFKARYWAKFLGIRARRKTTQAMLDNLAKARMKNEIL